MQLMTIEFARNQANLADAHSTEAAPETSVPLFALLEEWLSDGKKSKGDAKNLGGTMRLGGQACTLMLNTHSYEAYQSQHISERHRHRYEFNNQYKSALAEAGLIFAAH